MSKSMLSGYRFSGFDHKHERLRIIDSVCEVLFFARRLANFGFSEHRTIERVITDTLAHDNQVHVVECAEEIIKLNSMILMKENEYHFIVSEVCFVACKMAGYCLYSNGLISSHFSSQSKWRFGFQSSKGLYLLFHRQSWNIYPRSLDLNGTA
ncbi:hypothetical protein BDB01DRAFT_831619 [Pilobolus umbonatus]|nr:hypothetical protein BDB01DRAFT_831619 [Pilobolus umbonatus]